MMWLKKQDMLDYIELHLLDLYHIRNEQLSTEAMMDLMLHPRVKGIDSNIIEEYVDI